MTTDLGLDLEIATFDLRERTPALVWRRRAGAAEYERQLAMPVALIFEHVHTNVRAIFERGVVAEGYLESVSFPDGMSVVRDALGETRGVLLYVEPLNEPEEER